MELEICKQRMQQLDEEVRCVETAAEEHHGVKKC